MGSSNVMNGMNFFNLNTPNTTSSLFGSGGAGNSSATSTTYKESCKYGSSTHDDEDIENEDDGERLLDSGGASHVNKSGANNANIYTDRTGEHTSRVTGEESTN
jgi:hypothetical protein